MYKSYGLYISVNSGVDGGMCLENMLNNMFFLLEIFVGIKRGCTFVSVFMVKDFKVMKTSCRETNVFMFLGLC